MHLNGTPTSTGLMSKKKDTSKQTNKVNKFKGKSEQILTKSDYFILPVIPYLLTVYPIQAFIVTTVRAYSRYSSLTPIYCTSRGPKSREVSLARVKIFKKTMDVGTEKKVPGPELTVPSSCAKSPVPAQSHEFLRKVLSLGVESRDGNLGRE